MPRLVRGIHDFFLCSIKNLDGPTKSGHDGLWQEWREHLQPALRPLEIEFARLVGPSKARELYFTSEMLDAKRIAELGLANRVVPDDKLREETRRMALEVADRGAFALASIKGAFAARHGGVAGLSRVSHDLLLRLYLDTEESQELGASMREKRKPDPDKFGH